MEIFVLIFGLLVAWLFIKIGRAEMKRPTQPAGDRLEGIKPGSRGTPLFLMGLVILGIVLITLLK